MAAISRQEYLKRYLSSNDDEKKKKRKKKPNVGAKFSKSVIVDDDVSLSDIKLSAEAEFPVELYSVDEAPVVYDEDGVTAITTEHFEKREEDMKTRWVPVRVDAGESKERQTKSHDSDSDISPPTTRRRHDSCDISPPRPRRRHDSCDISPPRKRRSESPDISPPRRSRNVRDVSPHGNKTRNDSPDISPPRRNRHDSSPDLSPSRPERQTKPTGRDHSGNHSLSHSSTKQNHRDVHSSHKGKHLSQSDSTRRKKGSDSDISPPRRTAHNLAQRPDQSPPRRRACHDSDLSPPRRGRNSDLDQSPPRKRMLSPEGSKRGGRLSGSNERDTGKMGGLLSAKDLREDNELKRKRGKELLDKMDPALSGRDAKTVHRNKEGKIRNLKMERVLRREEEKKKEAEDEKFMQWGKGLVQTQKKEQKLKDDLHEMTKPLARYRNDADLDEMLRDQERQEDPMLKFMTKKTAKRDENSGKKAKPVYKGPVPPPNRFGIRPGYRWDGVDRSNGFEKKRFQMLSNKKSTQLQAYKWSTEDM